MMPPRSFVSSVYWASPGAIRPRSFESSDCRSSAARGPSTSISPMCETSKTPQSLAHGAVLGDDAFVLHRHLPACERDHARAGRDVLLEEGRPPERLHPRAMLDGGRYPRRGCPSCPYAGTSAGRVPTELSFDHSGTAPFGDSPGTAPTRRGGTTGCRSRPETRTSRARADATCAPAPSRLAARRCAAGGRERGVPNPVAMTVTANLVGVLVVDRRRRR